MMRMTPTADDKKTQEERLSMTPMTAAAPNSSPDAVPVVTETGSPATSVFEPRTPTRGKMADLLTNPHARRIDSSYQTPTSQLNSYSSIVHNLSVHGSPVWEDESLIDSAYRRLDAQMVTDFMGDNYANGKWKGWPADPSEKAVFAFLQKMGCNIQKALASIPIAGHDPRKNSRIIAHGNHAVRSKSMEKQSQQQKPEFVFIDDESAFPCRQGLKCSCKGLVCHCKDLRWDCSKDFDTDAAELVTANEDCTLPDLEWSNIRALAEHKANAREIGVHSSSELYLNFLNRAQRLFRHQAVRTHLHCFAIGGDRLRCYLITRSGVVTSHTFSIHDQPELTLRVFAAFFCGDLGWYGLETSYYHENETGVQIPYDCSSRQGEQINVYYSIPKGSTLIMDVRNPVSQRWDIVSRGTVVFKARQKFSPEWEWTMTIKESWRVYNRPHEGNILSRITDVPNIAKCIYYEDVTSTKMIRGELHLKDENRIIVRYAGDLAGRSTNTTKRSSTQAGLDSELDFSSRQSNKRTRYGTYGLDGEREAASKIELRDGFDLSDRLLSRTVLDTFGRPLKTLQTTSELLRGIRSGLEAHWSLYCRYKILHRDISDGNILLRWPSSKEARQALEIRLQREEAQSNKEDAEYDDNSFSTSGCLIDLDYAIDITCTAPSDARLRTGTKVFMAIGVLDGTAGNSYLHDLQSFFFVLLCVLTERSSTFTSSKKFYWCQITNDRMLVDIKSILVLGRIWKVYSEEALAAWKGTRENPSDATAYTALKKLLVDWRDLTYHYEDKEIEDGDIHVAENTMYEAMLATLDSAIEKVEIGGVTV